MYSEKELLRSLKSFAQNEHTTKRANRTEIRRLKPSSKLTRGPLPTLAIRQTGQIGFVVMSYQKQELRVYDFSPDGQLLHGESFTGPELQRAEKTLLKNSRIIYRLPLPRKRELALITSTKKLEAQYDKILGKIARLSQRKPQKKFVLSLIQEEAGSSNLEFDCLFSSEMVQINPDYPDKQLLLSWIAAACFIPQKLQILPIFPDATSLMTLGLVPKAMRKKMLQEWETKAVMRNSLDQEAFSTFVTELIKRRPAIPDLLRYLHKINRWLDFRTPGLSSSVILQFLQQHQSESLTIGDVGEIFLQLSEHSKQGPKNDLLVRGILCKYLESQDLPFLASSMGKVPSDPTIIELCNSIESRNLQLFLENTRTIRKKKTPALFELRERAIALLIIQSVQLESQLAEDGTLSLELHNGCNLSLQNVELQDTKGKEQFSIFESLSAGERRKFPWPSHLEYPEPLKYLLKFEMPELRDWGLRAVTFELDLELPLRKEGLQAGTN